MSATQGSVTDWLAAEQEVRRDPTGNATGNEPCHRVPSGPGVPTMLPPSLRSVGLPPLRSLRSLRVGVEASRTSVMAAVTAGPCPGTCDTGRDRTRDRSRD
jgi:hypothetical protein